MRENHGFTLIETLVGLTIIAVLVVGAYTLWQRPVEEEPTTTPTTVPSIAVTKAPTLTPAPTQVAEIIATPTPDPTVGWKTYANTQYKFRLKYPQNLTLTEKESGYFYLVDNPKDYGFEKPRQSLYVSHSIIKMDRVPLYDWVVEHGPQGTSGIGYFPSARNVHESRRNDYPTVEFDDSVPGWSIDTYNVAFKSGMNAHVFTLIPSNNTDMDQELFNQILSTFQFTD